MRIDPSDAERFLRDTKFSPTRAQAEFPNAQRFLERGLFVSHSGLDTRRIRDLLLAPVIDLLVPTDAVFFHSRGSGGAESYKRLVQAALHWCDKFMVVVSDASVVNEWVAAEVEWAVEHRRLMLAVCLDGRRFAELLEDGGAASSRAEVFEVDFDADPARGRREVRTNIKALLASYQVHQE
jgi:hypothetical protein